MNLPEIVEQLAAEAKERSPEGLHVDLGCGQTPLEGFLGVDYFAEDALHLDLFDSEWGVEFFEETGKRIALAYSSHFVEHVPDFEAFFVGLYDAMEDDGIAVIITPYWSSVRAFQDPTHRQSISEPRYLYLSRKWRKANKLDHGYLNDVDFEIAYAPIYHWHEDFAHLGDAQKDWHRKHSLGAVNDIVMFLRKCPPPSA